MRCEKTAWQLQLYLDNQLSLEEVHILKAHLSTCPTCRTELDKLEEVVRSLQATVLVVEPPNLTVAIMQRVALDVRQKEQKIREASFVLLRPSFQELFAAVLLATVSMLGLILAQPTIRRMLPIANGHDAVSMFFITFIQNLATMNTGTLSLVLWVVGTLLGVWITLVVAGNEMRSEWYKAVINRLPVW